jgi:hypothetical protein
MTPAKNDYPECDQFTGRKRCICRGEAGIPISGMHGVNAYRNAWGLPPIGSDPGLPSPPSPPALIVRGWNFTAAMARWTLAGMPRRTQAEIDKRLAICQACPFLENQHCSQCGCMCVEQNRLINKLALATEKCPQGKWQ